MIKLSTGLVSNVLGYNGITAMMNRGVIHVYTGEQPASANAAPTGIKLGYISRGGLPFVPNQGTNGLIITQRLNGSLADDGEWYLTGLVTGAAGWWRFKWVNNDPDTDSSYYPRLDGDVSEALHLPTNTIQAGETVRIDEFNMTFGVC